ncbi:hypothetical protein MPNT_190063 [Candidatus Methylacidithermus pantelleriae]|uniref:Uncharacterized protein n=1 Tax=Candidatus Methylacidithermus pantelleriae TaxID=2744239 RepID=A0A8J2BHP9_9BACT|nr:hypothetical protein MPNT_190063 [Candidatus Methylacidithermus pantelleriae]
MGLLDTVEVPFPSATEQGRQGQDVDLVTTRGDDRDANWDSHLFKVSFRRSRFYAFLCSLAEPGHYHQG